MTLLPYDEAALRRELVLEEGRIRIPYKDTKGKWTCGIGHNLDAHGEPHDAPASDLQIEDWYTADVGEATGRCDAHLPWWREMTDRRQRALVNMMFQMGWGDGEHGLSTFHTSLGYLAAQKYQLAGQTLRQSKWARTDSPARAGRMIAMLEEG